MFEGIRHPALLVSLAVTAVLVASAASGGSVGAVYIASLVSLLGVAMYLARTDSHDERN